MKVEQLMTADPATCSPTDHLGAAAVRMWDHDCGILPILDADRLVGVLTDRDICMALAMRGSLATDVPVEAVATGNLVACSPKDEVAEALALMGEHQVRRLPVTSGGRLVGLLSLNDVALAARSSAGKEVRPTYSQVIQALKAISTHRQLLAG